MLPPLGILAVKSTAISQSRALCHPHPLLSVIILFFSHPIAPFLLVSLFRFFSHSAAASPCPPVGPRGARGVGHSTLPVPDSSSPSLSLSPFLPLLFSWLLLSRPPRAPVRLVGAMGSSLSSFPSPPRKFASSPRPVSTAQLVNATGRVRRSPCSSFPLLCSHHLSLFLTAPPSPRTPSAREGDGPHAPQRHLPPRHQGRPLSLSSYIYIYIDG